MSYGARGANQDAVKYHSPETISLGPLLVYVVHHFEKKIHGKAGSPAASMQP